MTLSFQKYIGLTCMIALCLLTLSCKSTKRGTTKKLKSRSASWLLKRVEPNRVDAEWLNARARMKYDDDQFGVSATAYIRMKKDSAIWVAGKKLGIEVVRALITPDSVYVLDRLNKEYRVEGIAFLQRQFSLPVTYYDLQDILLGNTILMPDKSMLTAEVDSNHYRISEKNPESMAKSYWFDGEFYRLTRMNFTENAPSRDALIELDEYQGVEGANNFSYFRKLRFRSPETGQVSLDLNFTRVELNTPKSLSFEIPSHYTKVD